MNYQILIIDPLREMTLKVFEFMPTLFVSILILIAGWTAAELLKRVILSVLGAVDFNKVADKVGLVKFLRKGGIKQKPDQVVGCVFYILTMIMGLIITVKSLGMGLASGVIDHILAYVPHVVSGTVVLIIGMYLARFVSVTVYVIAKNTDMPTPHLLSKLSKWSIMFFVGVTFLKEIGFGFLFEGIHYTMMITGVIFSLSLAFGLAGKDIAGAYLGVLKLKKTTAK